MLLAQTTSGFGEEIAVDRYDAFLAALPNPDPAQPEIDIGQPHARISADRKPPSSMPYAIARSRAVPRSAMKTATSSRSNASGSRRGCTTSWPSVSLRATSRSEVAAAQMSQN
jgi:hypothetical protein